MTAFKNPIAAVKHLSKLAQLAGQNPSWVWGFTLNHRKLETKAYVGRKPNNVMVVTWIPSKPAHSTIG